MFNLHILHKNCNGKSIKNNNNNNNNDKLVIKSLQTFFTVSENEFLVLFIFSKIKCAFILSPRQISCQKGGLVYFANNFQIPLRNRNSSLECDMRYCCSTERERESSDSVSFCEGEPTNSHIVRCVCKFSGKETSMNLINKFHCRMAQTNLQQNACVFFLFNKTYLSLCNWQRNVLHVNELLQIEIRNTKYLCLFNSINLFYYSTNHKHENRFNSKGS